MTMILVAMCLMAILALFSFMIDITAALIRKEQIQTMAELGAAAGGRVVAEKIAELASKKFTPKQLLVLSDAQRARPYNYIDDKDRDWLQTNFGFKDDVKKMVEDYVNKNKPPGLTNFDVKNNLTVVYPLRQINCNTNPSENYVQVQAVVTYDHFWLLGALAKKSGAGDKVSVSALSTTGLYKLQICN